MASRYTIQMNFDQAKRQAETLENVARNLTNMANGDYNTSLQTLGNNWTGENATKYLPKAGQLKSNILKSASDLNKTASAIRTIAKNIYDAEMENLRREEEAAARARAAAEEAARAAAAAAAARSRK